VQKVFGHRNFILSISYSCSILMKFLPTKAELNVVLHCNFSIILYNLRILRVHELNTTLNLYLCEFSAVYSQTIKEPIHIKF